MCLYCVSIKLLEERTSPIQLLSMSTSSFNIILRYLRYLIFNIVIHSHVDKNTSEIKLVLDNDIIHDTKFTIFFLNYGQAEQMFVIGVN